MLLLGLGLRVLFAAAAVGTVAAIVVYVAGTINRSKLRQKAEEKNIKRALIEKIDYCDNVVTLKDLESGNKVEVRGDDVDMNLDEGDIIYA